MIFVTKSLKKLSLAHYPPTEPSLDSCFLGYALLVSIAMAKQVAIVLIASHRGSMCVWTALSIHSHHSFQDVSTAH